MTSDCELSPDSPVPVPAHCVAALVFSDATLDMPSEHRDRLVLALRTNGLEPEFWVRMDDLDALIGFCENSITLLPVTDEGRYQIPETKLLSGHVRLDYEAIFFTYAYQKIYWALRTTRTLNTKAP